MADQIEELWKEALAARQRLKYLLKKESLFEAQISQLQEEGKALRGLRCSVAASREEDASPKNAASDGGAISWTASTEVAGSEQGSQRHQVDHRQNGNQGSESGSESG